MTPKLSPKLTPREAKTTFSPQEGNPPHEKSSTRRTKQPCPTKATRLSAAQNLPREILTAKRKPSSAPSSNAARSDASAKASANAASTTSDAVRETRDAAAFAAMAARRRALFPEEVTRSKLLSELNKKRKQLGRKPLKAGQELRLRRSWEHHRSSPVTTSNRYQPLLDRIQATTAKDSGRSKLADVLTRMEKANDEPYTTGNRPHLRVNYNKLINDKFGKPIVCADHAGARAEDVLTSKDGKSEARKYARPESIYERMGDGHASVRFQHLRATAPIKAIIDCDAFGDFSKKQFSEMTRNARGRDRTRAGVAVIGDHTVPAWLKVENRDGRPRFVVNVGDFNRGNGDRRLQKPSPSRFAGYHLENFLTPAHAYATYVRNGSETFAIYLHDADVPTWKHRVPASAPTRIVAVDLSPQTLHHLFDGDFPFEPEWVCGQLEGLKTEQVATVLKAINPAGCSGMFAALRSGSALAIQSFGVALRAILADPRHEGLQAHVADLVSSKCLGHNGLQWALALGKADAIKAYGDLLVQLHADSLLTDDELVSLLGCRLDDGKPGLLSAVRQGRDRSVDSYLAVIARAPAAHRAALFSLTSEAGERAIACAMESGDDELTKDLFSLIRRATDLGAITLHQLAELSTSADLAKVASNLGGPSLAHRIHAAHVLEMIDLAEDGDESLGHLRGELTSIVEQNFGADFETASASSD